MKHLNHHYYEHQQPPRLTRQQINEIKTAAYMKALVLETDIYVRFHMREGKIEWYFQPLELLFNPTRRTHWQIATAHTFKRAKQRMKEAEREQKTNKT